MISNSPGTVADIVTEHYRALAFSIWSIGPMNGEHNLSHSPYTSKGHITLEMFTSESKVLLSKVPACKWRLSDARCQIFCNPYQNIANVQII